MSNFESLELINGGLPGSAPQIFVASTVDSYAMITAAGYLNDKSKLIKANDKFFINCSDASVFPLNTGEASILADLKVQYDPVLLNWNLIPVASALNGLSLIAQSGVHSALFTNAGGSASLSLNDSRISAGNIVIARWKSSANPAVIQSVLAGNGTLAVVASADPGASVLEYVAVSPSLLLQGSGVHSTQYSYAGGSATIVISDPLILAGSIVNANFSSQANAAKIDSVTATAGVLTIVASANPGVSVISYSAVTPSASLVAAGLYAAQYTNAGGSATTTITDANITAASIVTADWSSQANAVQIEKVTPSASTLTILSSGDPGASVLSYMATPVAE